MSGQYKFQIFLNIISLAYLISRINAVETKNNQTKKPHIIFIIADDMGWNDISFHGANQIPTPNIDALAYNGVILNKHYTLTMCTPSRTALMTGRYPIRDGMQGWVILGGEPRGIPLDVKLMPDYLQKLGYTTRLLGKWHLGYHTKNYTPARRGFQSFFGFYNGFLAYFNQNYNQTFNSEINFKGHDLHRDEPENLNIAYPDRIYFTDLLTEEAERIIKSHGKDKPLFLEISHLAGHAGSGEKPLQVRNSTENNKRFHYIKDENRRLYAGIIEAMDESVGRVITALDEAQMLENSIIVFISDNGAPTVGLYPNSGSNYPLRGVKSHIYEGGIRGAACIFSPLIKCHSKISQGTMHITDWLPTLYAAANGDLNDLKDIDGINQWPSIVKNQPSPRSSILLNIDDVFGIEAGIVGHYKILKDKTGKHQGYFGDSGNSPSYPTYNVKNVMSSPVSLAINKLTGHLKLTEEKILQLREQSTVKCNHAKPDKINCTEYCLFDLLNDPCETHDLSKKQPEIMKTLKSYMDYYQKRKVPQANKPIDPCANPKYFNNTWMPWIKDDFPASLIPPKICDHPNYPNLINYFVE